MNLKIDYCSYKAALYSVKHWHYSKSLPCSKRFMLGVWENDTFVGCVVFAVGNTPDLGRKYNIGKYEVCELSRVALNNHKTPVSKILKIAMIILKKDNPKLKLIISFADSNQNHLGIIYQATNWIYTGLTEKSKIWIYKGKEYHTRSVTARGYVNHYGKMCKCPKPKECDQILQKPKFRYLYPLTKDMRTQILKIALPYPKSLCVAGVNDSTSTFQVEGNGKNPIATLQI